MGGNGYHTVAPYGIRCRPSAASSTEILHFTFCFINCIQKES